MIDIDPLPIWTVYDHPSDYPREFVARKSEIGRGFVATTAEVLVAKTLAEIREEMRRRGLYRINRAEQDDPRIVECWL